MANDKEFLVKYRKGIPNQAGFERGLHGGFDTEAEANAEAQKCFQFFQGLAAVWVDRRGKKSVEPPLPQQPPVQFPPAPITHGEGPQQ